MSKTDLRGRASILLLKHSFLNQVAEKKNRTLFLGLSGPLPDKVSANVFHSLLFTGYSGCGTKGEAGDSSLIVTKSLLRPPSLGSLKVYSTVLE